MSVLIYDGKPGVGTDGLEVELTRAFLAMREAAANGDAVVVCVDERDVLGVGEPAQSALAHGLLGLARALAIEGSKPGWRIAVLSSTPEVPADERRRWIERLSEPGAASGTLVRLGGGHLGRVPT